MKKVSIITINLNNKEGLRRTAESVVSQTSFSEVEWIVIDGGSSDGSKSVIEAYRDKMAYCVSEPDKGIYNAMNKGVLRAHGEYVLFLNSGDALYKDDVIERFLSSNLYGIFDYCVGSITHEKNGEVIAVISPPEKVSGRFLLVSYLPHPSQFIKRERFKNQLYDESYRIAADTDFVAYDMIVNGATCSRLDYIVTRFDLSGISATQNNLMIEERKRTVYKVVPVGLQEDVISMMHPLYDVYDLRKNSLYFQIIKHVSRNNFLYQCFTLVNVIMYAPILLYRVVRYGNKSKGI